MLIPYRFQYLQQKRHQLSRLVELGVDDENGEFVRLDDDDRAVHTYICGVSGSGKSRFLENMVLQDIAYGNPLCFIDPSGRVYTRLLEFSAYCIEEAEKLGFPQIHFLDRYLFLDLDDPDNPLRINPLEPNDEETTEEQVDDLLKTAERLFGSLEEMRRLRNILRSTFTLIVELNRVPYLQDDPHLSPLWEGRGFPLNLRFATKFLLLESEDKLRLIDCLPATRETEYARDFWYWFLESFSLSQRGEMLGSSWNILQYFVGDSLVARFFDTQKSTVSIPDLMRRRRSLFCHLPLGRNLKGSQLVGTFLATKFQRTAQRRSLEERDEPYYLYMDEFQNFADQDSAEATAALRQYGLRLVNAHQSTSQPPFHTAEGQALLRTIMANSRVKVLFRLERQDAEVMAKEVVELTQRRENFRYTERAISRTEQRGASVAFSFQQTRGFGNAWSRAKSITLGQTKTLGVAHSFGTNIGRTLTEGVGKSIAEGLSHSISESESRGVTEAYSKTHGISVALGKTWSQLRDHRTGFSFTEGSKESLAVQQGGGRSYSESDQHSETETVSHGTARNTSRGSRIVHGRNGSVTYYDDGRESGSAGQSSQAGSMQSVGRSLKQDYSKAIGRIRGVTKGREENWGRTKTEGREHSQGRNESQGSGSTQGGTNTRTRSSSETRTRGTSREWSKSETWGEQSSLTRNWQQSLADAFTALEQFSRSYSQALQETVSVRDTVSRSEQQSLAEGMTRTEQTGFSKGQTITERQSFYSLEGERELVINELQQLPVRHCVVTKYALGAVRMQTLFVCDHHYPYQRNLPGTVLRKQRARFRPPAERVRALPEEQASAVIDDGIAADDDWPFEA